VRQRDIYYHACKLLSTSFFNFFKVFRDVSSVSSAACYNLPFFLSSVNEQIVTFFKIIYEQKRDEREREKEKKTPLLRVSFLSAEYACFTRLLLPWK
jgi:hypothetical protein